MNPFMFGRCTYCRHMEPGHNDGCMFVRAAKLHREIEEKLSTPEGREKLDREMNSRVVKELIVP